MDNCIERNKNIMEYIDNIQPNNKNHSEINPKKSIYIKKYLKSSHVADTDNEILETEYINNNNKFSSIIPASNAKRMNNRKKKILNNDYVSDNLSTNRNFNKLITKSQTVAKTNNKQFDKILLNTNEKSMNGSFLSGLNPNYIKTKYFKDVSTIKNFAKKSTKYTFDLIKNNTANINYENSLEGFVDLIVKIFTYCGKFIWIILCNFVLLIKSVIIIFIKYLNQIFSIWKRKNGLIDSTANLSYTEIANKKHQVKIPNKFVNNNKKIIKKENKKINIIKKKISGKKENSVSGNKFIKFFSNGISSIHNYFNNSFPQANVSLTDETTNNESSDNDSYDNDSSESKKSHISGSLTIIPRKRNLVRKENEQYVDKSKIMKYYPIKINNYESYNSNGKRKHNKRKINLKVGKKLGIELKNRIQISNLKTRKGIKKSINEIYDLLK